MNKIMCLAGQSEKTECQMLQSLHTSFASSYKPFSNSVGTNTALCKAVHGDLMTFRHLINAAKTPLSLLPAAMRLSASISYLPSLLNVCESSFSHSSSFTNSNISPFILILHSVSFSFTLYTPRRMEPSVKTLNSPLSADFWRHCVLIGGT